VVFEDVGCATCHVPSLLINRPIFSEPSQNSAYRDGVAFPAGQSTAAEGVTPQEAIKFNLTRDQPDNIIRNPDGSVRFRLGSLRRDGFGNGIVELFGDLKRHFMGPRLAEPVNEIAGDDVTPIPLNPRNRHTPETFLTENLWGVGSTAPYMHDGRATTLGEAIIEHGRGDDNTSEGRFARLNFINMPQSDRLALIAFLDNLVLFKIAEVEPAPPVSPSLPGLLQAPSRPRQVVKIAPKGFRIVLE
jgi:di-heme oxidoreductase (putative peroxidase)